MTSRWPELTPDTDGRTTREVLFAAAAAFGGGMTGWAGFYAGLGFWGLAVGALTMLLLGLMVTRLDRTQRLRSLLPLEIACILLTWPPAWVAVVLVRYWVTGKSVGS